MWNFPSMKHNLNKEPCKEPKRKKFQVRSTTEFRGVQVKKNGRTRRYQAMLKYDGKTDLSVCLPTLKKRHARTTELISRIQTCSIQLYPYSQLIFLKKIES